MELEIFSGFFLGHQNISGIITNVLFTKINATRILRRIFPYIIDKYSDIDLIDILSSIHLHSLGIDVIHIFPAILGEFSAKLFPRKQVLKSLSNWSIVSGIKYMGNVSDEIFHYMMKRFYNHYIFGLYEMMRYHPKRFFNSP